MKKLLFSFFLLAAMLAGCEKIGTIDLEGTTWRAVTEDMVYTLNFTNESECAIAISPNDDTLVILETNHYTWRYILPNESMFGEFLLETEEGIYAAGGVDGKTLYLTVHKYGLEPLIFKFKRLD